MVGAIARAPKPKMLRTGRIASVRRKRDRSCNHTFSCRSSIWFQLRHSVYVHRRVGTRRVNELGHISTLTFEIKRRQCLRIVAGPVNSQSTDLFGPLTYYRNPFQVCPESIEGSTAALRSSRSNRLMGKL